MRMYYKKGGKVNKKSMSCNKPKRTPSHPKKKFMVKACEDGKEKIIRYGDKNMKIKKSQPGRRKSFRAPDTSATPSRQARCLLVIGLARTGDDMPISRAQMGKQVKNAPKSKKIKAAKCRNGLARRGRTRGRKV